MKDGKVTYGSAGDFIFREALAFLEDRETLLPDEYMELQQEYKPLAFSVQGYTSLEILEEFSRELEKAITEGMTKEAFRENMNTFLEAKGYTGLNPTRANTIFLTNIQTAYNVGHYRSMTEPETVKLRPYWQYRTAGDDQVRDTHQAMEGKVYRHDDPIWDIWYPPNGFGCRCTVVTLSKRQMEQGGYELSTRIPHDVDYSTGEILFKYPDKGFSCNAAKVRWQPDVGRFPASLQKAYRDRAAQMPGDGQKRDKG